jgi:hypothetical protein
MGTEDTVTAVPESDTVNLEVEIGVVDKVSLYVRTIEVPEEFSTAEEKVGAVVSMTIALLFPSEPEAPGEARVSVALLPAVSLIVPPLRAREFVAT